MAVEISHQASRVNAEPPHTSRTPGHPQPEGIGPYRDSVRVVGDRLYSGSQTADRPVASTGSSSLLQDACTTDAAPVGKGVRFVYSQWSNCLGVKVPLPPQVLHGTQRSNSSSTHFSPIQRLIFTHLHCPVTPSWTFPSHVGQTINLGLVAWSSSISS